MKKLLFLATLLISSCLYAPSTDMDVDVMLQAKKERQGAKEMKRFIDAVAMSESGEKYTVWNKYGYIGKYQFGYSARKATGYADIHFSDFIKDPSIWAPEDQDSAMVRLLKINESKLAEVIEYVEENEIIVNGTRITKSGLLAGAHLGGYYSVLKYFSRNNNPRDVYGTSVEDYMVRFSGYDI